MKGVRLIAAALCALLAGALCIAIYLFTHPAREDDPADETKS